MKTSIQSLLAAALAGAALFTALPASADGRDWDRHGYREWRDGPPGHGWGHHKHWKHHHHHHYVERVVIRERPVYRDTYYAPPVRYAYPEPAVVVGVSIPPLVFPLR
jgi:hypothetical protein